ncbi:M4 family metallopeptidase [Hymenobacter sp. 15J16-1T3B]|uniref:M4 family metallopeptidase n=1 Tax=Hymenobacter sp. 15J16-1T3B TaxID=2886941 RepID=UPI001D11C2DC|nr:M4 family metallopeptidase [Hymenobacter sp. 15J16-1T3B]MCC3159035.1 M4 family metallopeptidase [Hymenobacter sp. 15J16-1T3B]
MKTTLALAGLLAVSGAFGAAQAQTARFKPTARSLAPAARPRINATIDGARAAELQRSTGPHLDAARLSTLARPVTASSGLGAVQLWRDAASGLPVFISATPKTTDAASRPAPADPAAASLAFLGELRAELQVQQPAQEFRVGDISRDALGQTHVRLTQHWRGLPVYGAEVVVHLDGHNQPTRFSGRHFRTPSGLTNLTPALAAPAAAAQAETALRRQTHVAALSADVQRLLEYSAPQSELVVYHPEPYAAPVLAWHVTTRPNVLERWETFVDAQTGAVLRQYESSCAANGPRTASGTDLNGTARTLNTYEWNNRFYLIDGAQPMFNLGRSTMPDEPVGALLTLDANNTRPSAPTITHVSGANNTSWTNRSAVSAHFNAATAYNYYRSVFNRNSLDGAGGTMISMVRLAEDDGSGMDNAFWNGRFIAYGEGNTGFTPLAGGLDVAGHEMTHGVVEKTANLVYQGQSGALNESMADVFGAMMDRADWLIGEDVVRTSAFPSGALRSLQDPHNGGTSLSNRGYQPRTMSELYTGTQDNGGVHVNSGIPNWAFYKTATAIGRDHAEQIWYRALTTYLTRSSQFLDLRLAAIQAATDLYGGSSADVTAVRAAFDAVGILGGTTQPPTHTLPTNPGQDYILSYDTNTADPGTLYRSNTAGANFLRLSTTAAISKPSLNDAGTVAVFVDAQHRLRALQLSPTVSESIIQNQPVWHNVAISKDGTKLAAVTMAQDTSIYVVNLASGQAVRYMLYNPTSAGTRGTGVMFADALEWDYSGEYLLYDSYNVISNAQGQDIDFWDIGFLRAWNAAGNTWGDGQIQKLVQNLPAGLSIGNPVLAKNSPHIMAFDLLDANAGTNGFSVMGLNVETGAAGTIFQGLSTPGTPSYSKLDDKMLFTAFNTAGDTVVAVTNLQADKITPSGTATVLISEGKWGVWYSQGQRVVTAAKESAATAVPGLSAYPNPAREELTLQADAAAEATLYDLLGRPVRTARLQPGRRSTLELNGLSAGTYVLRATAGAATSTRMIVKQ